MISRNLPDETDRNTNIGQGGRSVVILLFHPVDSVPFQTRSHSPEKPILASSCPSVCPHISARLPQDGFT
jgi:hypothetical protein